MVNYFCVSFLMFKMKASAICRGFLLGIVLVNRNNIYNYIFKSQKTLLLLKITDIILNYLRFSGGRKNEK